MESGLKLWGILGASALVVSNDSPATVKVAAKLAKVAFGDRIQICDGVNDHVEIQAAIDALPAAGGEVLLLEGTYYIEVALALDSYQTLRGCGRNTILTTTTPNINIITATGGAGTEKVGILIADLCVDGNAGGVANLNGISWSYVDYSKIMNVWSLNNANFYNIGFEDNCDFNQIIDNVCQGGYSGIYAWASLNNIISGNIVQGASGNAIYIQGGSNNNVITGNTCQGNTETGIYTSDSDNNIITGNACQGNSKYGIRLYPGLNNTISGNTCQGNGIDGIYLSSSSNNNIITGNTCQGNTNNGIYLENSGNNTITGNTCQGNGTGVTKYSGIYIYLSSETVIAGNQCEGNGLHGIKVERCSYCTIIGNVCNDQQTGDGIYVTGIFDAGNSNYNSITGNVCYNNGDDGIEIAGGADANKNIVLGNQLLGNTGTPLVDNGLNTEIGHNITV